jgi:type IV pilus assembly protein PilB
MLPVTREVRMLIEHGAGREQIEKELKSKEAGFISLHDNGVRLVREGITTSSEVLRVINEEL